MTKMDIGEAVDKYINNRNRTEKTKSTTQAYRTDYNLFKEYMLREKSKTYIQDISEDDLFDYRDYLKYKKEYKVATVNRKLNALKSLFGYLKNINVLETDYMKVIQTKRPFEDQEEKFVLSPDEVEKLISTPNLLKDKNWKRSSSILYTLAYLGLRRGELLNLKVKDFDMNKRTLLVRRSKTRTLAILPLHDRVFISIMNYLKDRNKLSEDEYLFLGDRGGKFSENAFSQMIRHYVDKSGLGKEITAYTLRHTFITNLNEEGLSSTDIMKWTGHKDIRVLDTYIHATEKTKNKVMEGSFSSYNRSKANELRNSFKRKEQ